MTPLAATQQTALRHQIRASRSVNRAVYATAAQRVYKLRPKYCPIETCEEFIKLGG